MQSKIQRLEGFITDTEAKPPHSLLQQVEIWITLMRLETELKRENKQAARDRPKVLLKLGIRHDSIGTDKWLINF